MLRRLFAWCVPESALRLRAPEQEMTDVQRALSPYEEDTAADALQRLRIIHD
jgi:hypothetical protein